MKRFLGYAAILVLLSAPAFAAKNSSTITINQAVTVGTTQLPAAEYRISWTGTGSNAQVTFENVKDVKSTVTVPAKVVDQKNAVNSVLTSTKGGTNVLEGINLNKVTLVLTSTPASGQ